MSWKRDGDWLACTLKITQRLPEYVGSQVAFCVHTPGMARAHVGYSSARALHGIALIGAIGCRISRDVYDQTDHCRSGGVARDGRVVSANANGPAANRHPR
jgi:hypothetical protein